SPPKPPLRGQLFPPPASSLPAPRTMASACHWAPALPATQSSPVPPAPAQTSDPSRSLLRKPPGFAEYPGRESTTCLSGTLHTLLDRQSQTLWRAALPSGPAEILESAARRRSPPYPAISVPHACLPCTSWPTLSSGRLRTPVMH